MNRIVRAALLLLALVSGAVLADGVPLFIPAPMPTAAVAGKMEVTKHTNFVKLHPLTLNKNAFGSNVLTVTMDGKEYRFVGGPMAVQPGRADGFVSWAGKAPGGGRLSMVAHGGLAQQITLDLPPARQFKLDLRSGALVETDRNVAPVVIDASKRSQK